MTLNSMHRPSGQNGFSSLLNRRAAMQQWSVVSRLLRIRENHEASEIVASFQIQMEVESTTSAPFNGKAA